MSRPDRPYRATHVGPNYTTHRDYPNKEARVADSPSRYYRYTTVTSRKPVKRGEPVCWVNVYENSDGKFAGGFTHRTERAAALSSDSTAINCIPVYLPGEGAVTRRAGSGPMVPMEEHNREVNTARAEVERLTKLHELMSFGKRIGELESEAEQWKEAAEHAEGKLAEERMSSQTERKECDKLRAEVERLTKELAEAQAIPAEELVSLRRVYAAAYWHYVPATNLDSAVEVHRAKFGPPETVLTLRGRTEIKEKS